jgi:hypothetical protein
MAKSKGIDLSKFKHVSSDKNSTRLKHDDGHFLVIAHKGVSGDLKAHLAALSANSQPKPNPSAVGQSAKDAMDTQDRAGYKDGGNVYGAPDVDQKMQQEADHAKAVTTQDTSPSNGTDVRTPDQKARAAALSAQNGYAKGGEAFNGTPASNNSEGFDPNKQQAPNALNAEPYSRPATNKTSEGVTVPQDTRSTGDKVRDAGRNFKQATGATYGMASGGAVNRATGSPTMNYADGGQARKMYAEPQGPVSSQDTAPVQQDPTAAQPAPQDQDPGLMAHIGEAIGKWGINPVVKTIKAIGYAGGTGVHNALQGAGHLTQGIEKGTGTTIPTPETEAAEDAQKAQLAQQQQQVLGQTPAQGGAGPTTNPLTPTNPASTGADPNGLPPIDPITTSVQSAQNYFDKSIADRLAGEQGKAEAVGIEAKAAQRAMDKTVAAQQDATNKFQQNIADLNKERQAHISDIQNGHIDPNLYWTGDKDGNGSHSKVASAIGMILAGFNPTNRPNAAVDMLKYQMDKAIDAQKTNLNSNQNLLNANIQQYGNVRQGLEATRIMYADMATNQLKSAAMQAATPMAKAAALSASGQIEGEASQRAAQLGMMQTVMHLGSGQSQAPGSVGHTLGYLDQANPEQAKEYRSRYYAPLDVPGGKSIADRPIAKEDRDFLTDSDKFETTAKHLQGIMARHQGLDPSKWSLADRTLAAQDSQMIQSLYRGSTLGTVYKAGEQPLLDKAIDGQPLDLIHYFTEPTKIQGLIDNNSRMRGVTLNNYGLRGPQTQQQNPNAQAKAWLQDPKNANDPRRAAIAKKIGQ